MALPALAVLRHSFRPGMGARVTPEAEAGAGGGRLAHRDLVVAGEEYPGGTSLQRYIGRRTIRIQGATGGRMRHSRSSMRGAGAVTILALIFLAVLVGTFALTMGTQYTQYLTVRSIMQEVAGQPGAADKSERELWQELDRRFSINSVYDGIEEDDFSVTHSGDRRQMKVEYEVRREFLGNVDVVARFSRTETLAP